MSLTKPQLRAVDVYAVGGSDKQAAEEAGVSIAQALKWRTESSPFQNAVERRVNEITDRRVGGFATGAPQALNDVMKSTDSPASAKVRAAQALIDAHRAGKDPLALTLREERFVEAFLTRNGDPGKAAQDIGYSAKGARAAGLRLMLRTSVQAAIRAGRAEIVSISKMNRTWVLEGLMREAEGAPESSSRIRARELCGKTIGMFVDVVAEAAPMTEQERLRRLRELVTKAAQATEKGSQP